MSDSATDKAIADAKGRSPLVYVIILNYNNLRDTIETIGSVQVMRYDNFKVLLVENSTDRAVIEAIRVKFPGLEIMETGRNLGYAGGNNAGILHTMEQEPDYIFVLNNDLRVEPDILTTLVHELEFNRDCAACQPLVVYAENPEIIWSAGTEMYLGYPRLYLKNGSRALGHPSAPPFGLVGCALLFRVSALRDVGLFDESLFLMHEETDWCIRAKKKGYSLLVVPAARVQHKVSVTLGSLSAPYLYYVSRNWLLVARKHFKLSGYLYVLLTEVLVRFPYYCWLLLCRGELRRIRSYLSGLKDGLLSISGEAKSP
ncbi:glycosyltransferase family 2 protein [Methanoculleus palmolei]|uniref:Glycosyltransferase family 2 protein n=1 Tax=Methanoculleus palmolei TaxID=72612 RepID=A0ABD8ACJ5_9EURY|nr:glycosyltransferase family 2 protein [Methanoculleus palmolei]